MHSAHRLHYGSTRLHITCRCSILSAHLRALLRTVSITWEEWSQFFYSGSWAGLHSLPLRSDEIVHKIFWVWGLILALVQQTSCPAGRLTLQEVAWRGFRETLFAEQWILKYHTPIPLRVAILRDGATTQRASSWSLLPEPLVQARFTEEMVAKGLGRFGHFTQADTAIFGSDLDVHVCYNKMQRLRSNSSSRSYVLSREYLIENWLHNGKWFKFILRHVIPSLVSTGSWSSSIWSRQ